METANTSTATSPDFHTKMPKKETIEALFDNIAPSYDRLNHILSLNIDKRWRRRAVKELFSDRGGRDSTPCAGVTANVPQKGTCRVLDIACGTGDFAIAIAKKCGAGGKVTGVDISENMLAIGREKIAKAGFCGDGVSGVSARTIGAGQRGGGDGCHGADAKSAEPRTTIDLQYGDCENLPFPDGSFDRVGAAFGVRNFEHMDIGLKEMHRVLAAGGKMVILELSIPPNKFVAGLYRIYFEHILPWVGKLLSGDKPAYKYLPASVLNFPAPEKFCGMLREAGFADVRQRAFSLGICRMYVGCKL